VEAIERIERYGRGRTALEREELIQSWIVHHIEIIGEAASNVSEQLRTRHPEIPWRRIVDMRNVLIHGYFGIDLSEVWRVVENDLPRLKEQVKGILEAS
jgi:uncharacterized protein with HEPN domain